MTLNLGRHCFEKGQFCESILMNSVFLNFHPEAISPEFKQTIDLAVKPNSEPRDGAPRARLSSAGDYSKRLPAESYQEEYSNHSSIQIIFFQSIQYKMHSGGTRDKLPEIYGHVYGLNNDK